MSYILAADPGGMTGYAYMWEAPKWDPDLVQAGQLTAQSFCGWVSKQPAFLEPGALIIFETFTITASTARKTPQPDALETIGVLKFLAHEYGARIESQSPASAKNFCTDKQLRKLGLWRPGQDHARDAIRHLVLGICTFGAGQLREELLQSLA